MLILASVAGQPGFAQQNNDVALVIGDAAYPDADAPLKEPVSDARALADELRRRGFTVDVGENLKKEAMKRALDRFYDRIKPNATALIFFSGFGIQSDRQSYMIPVDAQLWNEADVRRDGFSLDKVLGEMASRGAEVKVAIVDASRHNPFERRFRSVSAGLAAVTASKGSVVMSSAPPDTVISESSAPVFVTELIKELKAPGATIEQIFNRTRLDVSRATQGQQVPWFSSALEEDVAFGSQSKPAPGPVAVAPATATQNPATASHNTAVAAKSDERPAASAAADSQTPKPAAKSTEPPATSAEKKKEKKKKTAAKTDARPAANSQANAQPAKTPETKTASKSNEPPAAAPARPPVSSPDPEAEARHDYVAAEGIGTRQAWDDFIRKHPSGYYHDRAREQIAKLTPDDSPKDVAGFYRRGQHHAVDGEYASAIDDFSEVIRRDPRHAGALNNRCWVRAIVGDLSAALRDCNEALRIAPNYMDALDSRGLAELKIGKLKEAIADYDAALQIDPQHASSLYGRGIAELRSGAAAASQRDVDAAKAIKSTIADEFAGYGIR